MADFFSNCLYIFRMFVHWCFTTPSGFGPSIGGLLAAINVIGVIIFYLWKRYK